MARSSFRRSGTRSGGKGSRAGVPNTAPEARLREAWRLIQEGRPGDAESLCRALLAQRPEDAGGLHLHGVIALRAGRLPEAAAFIDRALAQAPCNPDFLVDRGTVDMAAGRAAEGIACFRRALEARSGHGEAHLNLGAALMRIRRPEEAITHLREAARLMPKSAAAHTGLGMALSACQGPAAGLRWLRKATALAPNDARVRENLGNALFHAGNAEAALVEFEAALALAPQAPSIHFGQAQALQALKHYRQAVAAYEHAIALDDTLAPAHNNLALLLARRERLDEAVVHLRRAVALQPEVREIRLNLADVLAWAGRVEEAESTYRALQQEFPDYAEAYVGQANALQQDGRFDSAREVLAAARRKGIGPALYFPSLASDRGAEFPEDELERVAAIIREGSASAESRAHLCFAMGRVFETRKDYDAAFDYYRRGNEIRDATSPYEPAEQHRRTDRLMRTFDEAFFAARRDSGVTDDRPVFVVGMMRSGTSLIEQIIASHPLAAGAGELQNFQILAHELPEILGSGTKFPECARELDGAQVGPLAQDYLERLSSGHPDARRVTDKMPVNFLNLGLIALFFPRAHIVHCVRDPLDTCLSIYTQDFRNRHDYAYDMNKIAHFYGEYRSLMAHWRRVLPLPILDMRYEELVAEPEPQMRRMLDFLGLDWDDGCLRFHEKRRSVQTASDWQVRQPMYSSSIARWRRFERHLEPLVEALARQHGGTPEPGA